MSEKNPEIRTGPAESAAADQGRQLAAKTPAGEGGWTTVVSAKRPLIDFNFGEIWRYRDLIYLLVRRDFIATYKQTILGPLWFLIQPLFSTIVFTIIFGQVAKLPTDNIPPFLFYMCGLVAWGYFADCLNKSASTFTGNANIFSKVYFPRLTVPIANAITNLATFGIQFALFLVVLGWFIWKGAPIHINYRVVILPLLILQMALLGIGFGCIVSSLTTRYRDLSMLFGFFVQLWMYASCVLFPLSLYPESVRWLLVLNPMVPVIETFRFAFLGAGTVEIPQLLAGAAVSLVIFVAGIMIFRRTERTFCDTI
jgi:lipopolysaccharide transport system permease protein